jgi:2-C-methyl-D-erythritol 2,4-cyclodiphosphate synthase
VDSIVIAESPKLGPHIAKMKEVLCPYLHIQPEDMGIKAKTNEGIGAIGQGEAIATVAIALLELG